MTYEERINESFENLLKEIGNIYDDMAMCNLRQLGLIETINRCLVWETALFRARIKAERYLNSK